MYVPTAVMAEAMMMLAVLKRCSLPSENARLQVNQTARGAVRHWKERREERLPEHGSLSFSGRTRHLICPRALNTVVYRSFICLTAVAKVFESMKAGVIRFFST